MNLITPDTYMPPAADLGALQTISPGQRIVILLPNGRYLAEVLLTCYQRGLVAVPVDPGFPRDYVKFIIEHCQGVGFYRQEDGFVPCVVEAEASFPDDRFIIYTSGSTGNPKGVVLTKTAVEHNAITVSRIHGFIDGAPHATCLPLFHCNALMMSLIGCFLTGNKLIIQGKFEPKSYFNVIEREGAKTASIIPAYLHQLVSEAPEWPPSLAYLITAAAPLPKDLARRFYELYGPRLRQGYGLSEAVNFSFLTPLLSEAEFKQEYLENHPPVGVSLPGTEARIVNGEVQVRGPNLMRCYWRNPDASAKAFTEDGWLRTGDLGEFRGRYLVLKGRAKEIINRGGETLYPVDIEQQWETAGLQRPFSAVPIDNDVLFEDIGLWVEQETEPGRVLDTLGQQRYRPGAVQSGPLLTTSTGKPQRLKMGSLLFSAWDNELAYDRLLLKAREVASTLLKETDVRSPSGSSGFILDACRTLVVAVPEAQPIATNAGTPAAQALDLLQEHWSELLQGKMTGEQVIQQRAGLWTRLMHEWPMGVYAQLVAQFLTRRDLLSGRVLELGAGVGNASVLIRDKVGQDYIRTDLFPKLVQRVDAPGTVERYDFNEPGRWRNLDTIFAVNALHCARNKLVTLRYLREMLREDGVLVLAEGAPTTTSSGTPWALNALFGLFQGWWNIGGFLPRRQWLELLVEAGFRCWAYSSLRAGRHDLGGLIWAAKG